MYKTATTLAFVAVLLPSLAFAKAVPCQYEDRTGIHAGVYTSAGGDGALCVDRAGKGHDLYAQPVKTVHTYTKPVVRTFGTDV